ncbi:MAG: ABC transporter ATP-binding protein [Coriobacteriaceae bacterium]|nr:ABC transporter ATP-binding protein [Coriobacteriaceae bacterium]
MRGFDYIVDGAGRARLCALALLIICFQALYVGLAMLLSRFLDLITMAISTGNADEVLGFLPFATVYSAVLGVLVVAGGWYRASVVQRVMVGVRARVAGGLVGGDAATASNSAQHLTVLGQNMDTVETDWLGGIIDIFQAVVQIMFAVVMLVCINPLIAILSIAATALPTFVPRLFGRRLAAAQGSIVEETQRYNARVRDSAIGGETVRSYHIGPVVLERHDAAARTLELSKAHLSQITAVVSGISGGIGVLVQLCIMGATGLFALSGLVSVGSVIAVTQLSGDVISPASEISSKLAKVHAGQEILALFRSIENQSEKGGGRTTCTRRITPAHTFGLEGVSFAYDGEERQVLRDCSVRFEAGRKYAITGASGGGKSTLLGILSGALVPQAGSVFVDGEAGALPESVSIHQSVFLFDGTLRENITLWGTFGRDDIVRAIRLAGLDGVVTALPQGLDTPMGENGARLSGGERQRVAIARALLHGKKVLLVDEATSALDAAMAAQVEAALLALDGVTVIAVTHRLGEAYAVRYDEVLEMRGGRLVGEGSAEGRLGPAAT